MTPEKIPTEHGGQNHQKNFYNYNTGNRICMYTNTTATVKMSIDFIRFSIKSINLNNTEFYNLFNVIKGMSVEESNFHFVDGYGYSQIRKYSIEFQNKIYKVVASRCPSDWNLPILLTVHEPSVQLLQYLKQYLAKVNYLVSSIEHTLDFYSDVPDQIYQFLKSHLLLKWAGKKKLTLNYPTTFYRNDIRNSRGKGLRCYRKQHDIGNGESVESVRVELVMKRPLLKTKSVSTIDNVLNMDCMIAMKYLSYKDFNFNKFTNRLKNKDYTQQQIDQFLTVFKNDIKNGFLYELNNIALSYSQNYDTDDYLIYHDFQQYFMGLINGKSFINGDTFSVDLDRMQ